MDNNFVPYRENDKYTEATEMTVKAVLKVVAEEYEVEIEGLEGFEENTHTENESEEKVSAWVWILIIIIAVLYVIASIYGDDDFSGGYHSYGGFSSGSSRGSFGGGRSGGGGASR